MNYIDPASAKAAADENGQSLEHAVDAAGDTEVVVDAGTQQVGNADDDADAPARAVNPVFTDRADIANRFKARREQRNEDIVAAAEAHVTADTAADGADTTIVAEQRADEPRKIKVKVRHQERELTEDELIAAAQKTLAGDEYLEEARKLLEDAKQLAPSRPHQDGDDAANTDRQAEEAADPSHQTDEQLAERLQFGLPEEAAEVIKQLRKSGTTDPGEIQRAVYDSQRNVDVTKATRAYEKFVSANGDLVKDPIAHAAMEAAFYNGVRTDLRKLGYTDEQLPTATAKLVEAHRFHRIQGQDVRDTAALLEDSKLTVEKFRGAKSGDDEPAPGARKDNTVAVRVDRSERRAGIPLQPARSALPAASNTQPQPVQNARKAAVQKMAASGRRLIST